MISKKHTSSFFYFGTLLSSVGSMTLTISLIAFMLKSGFSLLQVSIIIGASRFIPVIVSVVYGHKFDEYAPRKLIIWTEVLASLASVLLFFNWQFFDKNYALILLAMLLRVLFTSAQTGSRGQIAKVLSSESYQSNSKNAIWLNKVTQGATLFGGIIAWWAIEHSDFSTAIVFDAVTFITNGAILFFLPIDQSGSQAATAQSVPIFKKFTDLYHYNRWAEYLDVLLVLSMMGTSSFTARLAGKEEVWISLFVISFGLAVWLAGFVERVPFIQKQRVSLWVVLGVTLALLGTFKEPTPLMWAVCFVKDIAYWILFHRITSHIQNDTPKELMASVTFARTAQMISIFAIGEVVVGLWKNTVSLETECLLRAGVCLGAILLILAFGKREKNEKAYL